MNLTIYKSDCKHFLGYIPCKPHKLYGVHCDECEHYSKVEGNILIIKLGAIGDVIRTTPLLHRLWAEFPNHRIWWLTYSPDIIPASVDRVLNFDAESVEILKSIKFDLLINLDKDLQACALASSVQSTVKRGFIMGNAVPAPIDELAQGKFLTGLFDDVSKANTKSYLEEIFEICGWKFAGEEYIMDCDPTVKWELHNQGKPVIGLNTGCGARWVSRLWSDANWVALIEKLQDAGYFPLLLGGKQEHEKNEFFASKTNCAYLGYFSLPNFISLVNHCDTVVSAVTMGMHIAMGLKKNLVLMNNIFNPAEFELYGRGEIVMPSKPCECYFSPKCKNTEYFCMDYLSVDAIFQAVRRTINS
ncbi:MAG: glycosyltransferase family 9 protein [Desulfobulbaceae bacterium]|nr:glycosyltransferase family 9 protein [Candidatus Kapabacteria bacterium]MBS4000841.1 glycosyltransferase family 9 protein [Desulfobulbaceae bacterium]